MAAPAVHPDQRVDVSPAPVGSPGYWDGAVTEALEGPPLDVWRAYMLGRYTRLLADWVPDIANLRGLKTDLFEEAVSDFNPMASFSPGSVGIDGSPGVVSAARKRIAHDRDVVVCDLRSIPLASESIDFVLSGSSIDHFPEESDIVASLSEIGRLLKSGGTLVLTLDNPHNPVVWLRNKLPFALLNRCGLVPYYVGVTMRQTEARRWLEALGLEVTASATVAHVPRLPALWIVTAIERAGMPSLRPAILAAFTWFEWLERLPTRSFTGYYLAFRAVKRVPEQTSGASDQLKKLTTDD